MEIDDGLEVFEGSDCQGSDCYTKRCPIDGFVQFSEVVELENQEIYRAVLLDESKKEVAIGFIEPTKLEKQETYRAVLLDESKKEVAVGFFHRSEIKPFDAVYVKVMNENEGGYLVYYNATSQSYGFMQGGAVWIPKNLLSVMTTRTIRGIADGRMVTLKCKCGEELVMAVGLPRTLAACPKCKCVDHVV